MAHRRSSPVPVPAPVQESCPPKAPLNQPKPPPDQPKPEKKPVKVDYSEEGIRKLGERTGLDKDKLRAEGLSDPQITTVRAKARKIKAAPSDPDSDPLLAPAG